MPNYTYICDSCGTVSTLSMSMGDFSQFDCSTLICTYCKQQTIRRYFEFDIQTVHSSIKLDDNNITLGHLAHRNTERMSDEEKARIHAKNNAYKYEEPQAPLPQGMTRKTQPSTIQRHVDPKRHKRVSE